MWGKSYALKITYLFLLRQGTCPAGLRAVGITNEDAQKGHCKL